MDNVTPKLAATFGVGFLGFILAAYSYNKYHKPDYSDDLLKTTEIDNEQTETNQENTENIKLDIKEEVKKTITSQWSNFWKKEFADFKNNGKEVKSNDTN